MIVKGSLFPYRVLDLTDEKGWMCGKVLSDLGADVVKVEPPGGDPGRNKGPFFHDSPHPEKSLQWFAYNTNKRGITLSLEAEQGRRLFEQLAGKADFIVESFPPGYLEGIGIGYSRLRELNPRVILLSITDFGQSGPYRDYKGCDLVAMAMGGFMYVCGDADRPPVRISIDHAYPLAAAQAASAALIASYQRLRTGEGQWIDVSVRECIVRALHIELGFWNDSGEVPVRSGPRRRRMSSYLRDVWPCKDGHLGFRLLGGRLGAGTLRALAEWMESEGMVGSLKGVDFESLDLATTSREQLLQWEDTLCRFFMRHTKDEIYNKAMEKRMLICPSFTMGELAEYEQLEARNFWMELDYPELGCTIRHPRRSLISSEAPCEVRRRAPLVGEHNEEIYTGELGMSRGRLGRLRTQGVI